MTDSVENSASGPIATGSHGNVIVEARDFLNGRVSLRCGDCLDAIRNMVDNSVDAIVTDPPYALTSISERFGKEGAAPAQFGTDGAFARASKGFMGKTWDTGERAFATEFWRECLRVLKPGGHLVAFSATRTYHRMAMAIELGGFDIRDQLAWAYGTGFPKSHNVAKAIQRRRVEDVEPVRVICRAVRAAMDARGWKSKDLVEYFGGCDPRLIDHWAARDTDSQPSLPTPDQWRTLSDLLDIGEHDDEVERLNARKNQAGDAWTGAAVVGEHEGDPGGFGEHRFSANDRTIREASEDAAEWEGWGTALKPAWEPIVLARKPLQISFVRPDGSTAMRDATVAECVLANGTGALNVGACMVGTESVTTQIRALDAVHGNKLGDFDAKEARRGLETTTSEAREGRFPANLLHDGSDEVVSFFPAVAGGRDKRVGLEPGRRSGGFVDTGAARGSHVPNGKLYADSGSAARFFQSAPYNDADRATAEAIATAAPIDHELSGASRFFYSAKAGADDRNGLNHPTIKPVDLMRWLVRLVTRRGGVVLDPFAGTGTTGEAAYWENCSAILCEREDEYQAAITTRMGLVLAGPDERKRARTKAPPPEGLPLFGPAEAEPGARAVVDGVDILQTQGELG